MRGLDDREEIALDTEGDSLHHYPERLALIQLADRGGAAWFVDPLVITDLSPLAPVLAHSGRLLVLHAGDNDLVQLKRRYAFAFGRLFDTSIAARFLGVATLGLEVLLDRYLGVTLPPSRQKDDWSERPLTPAQETYAVADVQHLIALKDVLVVELRRAGRLAWVEEECAALAAEPVEARSENPDAWAAVKGARTLPPRSLAALRELYALREETARALDRPPFKVLGDATLLALAATLPAEAKALATIPGCTPRVIGRWGASILAALDRARSMPEERLPALPRNARPNIPAAIRRRIDTFRQWRAGAAPTLGLEPGVLLPNRLIRAIAEAGPRDLDALARVPGLHRWRVETLGGELLAALARK